MFEFSLRTGLELIAVIGVAFFVWYVISLAIVKVGRRAGVSRAQLVALRKVIRLLAILLAVLSIVNVMGLGSQLELLTVAGLGALVAALLIEGMASNLLYGLLAIDRDTIRLGDIVEIVGTGNGTIVKLNLRNIWIKTDNGALVVIEYSRIEHGRLLNYSAAERLKEHFDSKDSIN